MPKIRCHYIECIFLDDGYCGAAAIELDPDVGCMTFTRAGDEEDRDEGWDDEEELEEWDEEEEDDEDDDIWSDEEPF
jgi:hypothetical protein